MFRILPKRHAYIVRAATLLLAWVVMPCSASADFFQQGPKLIGTAGSNSPQQGHSVAISADGNTAIVGGPYDAGQAGAAWVFVRNNGAWTQQGDKLVSLSTDAAQGFAVAISADGNTAIIGGPDDSQGTGAAWIFVRNNGVWSLQGDKLVGAAQPDTARRGWAVALSADGNTALVGGPSNNSLAGGAGVFMRTGTTWAQQGQLYGTGSSNNAAQGISVALSADGNTALIGGYADSSQTGAAWIFNRNAGTWSQVGDKLVGTLANGSARQGMSVALSADGKTAALGGPYDAGRVGAAWVFAFDGSAWVQQGGKLVGAGGYAVQQQGQSVSLSRDGDTLFSGGYVDSGGAGATWVFTRSNGAWSQFGGKLVGTSAINAASQGYSAALSADGSTAIVGGYGDNSFFGASWIWTRRTSHDFNGGGKSDVLWRNTSGDIVMWLMNGLAASSVAGLGNIGANWTPVGQRDFNGDGKTDILWRESSGAIAMWLMSGASALSVASLGNIGANWSVAGTADFDGDGKGDILWRDTSGNVAMWLMNGTSASSVASFGNVATNWSVAGTADFNGDGKSDILWRNTDGANVIWLMNGTSVSSVTVIGGVAANWNVVGTADFDGDGKGDILWRNTDGSNAVWLMNGTNVSSVALIGGVATNWSVASNGDYDGDGKGDILWREAGGSNAIWLMNGTSVASVALVGGVANTWSIQNAGAD